LETGLEVFGRELNGFRTEVKDRFAVPIWAVGITPPRRSRFSASCCGIESGRILAIVEMPYHPHRRG
jgi:hypothetical protein